MKPFGKLCAGAVLLAAVLVTGCASTGSTLSARDVEGTTPKDLDYIYAVERSARLKGVRVVWVNPPPELGKDYAHIQVTD